MRLKVPKTWKYYIENPCSLSDKHLFIVPSMKSEINAIHAWNYTYSAFTGLFVRVLFSSSLIGLNMYMYLLFPRWGGGGLNMSRYLLHRGDLISPGTCFFPGGLNMSNLLPRCDIICLGICYPWVGLILLICYLWET